jgi:hypothetical protein
MPFDFPASPATGTSVTTPGGSYTYDGTKWAAAPSSGLYMPLSGGTFTGPVTLAADPAAELQPVTLQYEQANAGAKNIGRNLLHNGLFNVQQRGAGPWSTQSYTADRWMSQLATTGGSLSITLAAVTASSAASSFQDEACEYLLAIASGAGTGTSDFAILTQRVEDLRRLSGKTVIVSFWAASQAGTPKIGVEMTMNFGTGGSPTGQWNGASNSALQGQAVPLSTTWARHSVVVAMPSAASATFGTNAGTSFAELNLWISAGSGQNLRSGSIGQQTWNGYIWGVQLEIAQPGQTQPTPLEKPDPRYDLSNCQRFYQPAECNLGGYAGAGGVGFTYNIPFMVEMRASPTVSVGTTNYTNVGSVSFATSNHHTYCYSLSSGVGGFIFGAVLQLSADL